MSIVKRHWIAGALLAAAGFALPAGARDSALPLSAADALFTDPPLDAAHPASMAAVHIPTHGVSMNGVLYRAAGAGPHPVLIFFHGMPGNEQNLDLAQAARRLGWNVLTFHYRGSWGSPGTFSYPHLLEDGQAALAFARDPATVARYGLDAHRIVLVGYSTGGFVAVNTLARSAPVAGLILISGTDDGAEAKVAQRTPQAWSAFVRDDFADSMESLVGCTPDGLADELRAHADAWSFGAAMPGLKGTPLLAITADDGFAPDGEALAQAMQAGGSEVQTVHMATDHGYSDHRIALTSAVGAWLRGHTQP
jgi:acetyl esterase/lipase